MMRACMQGVVARMLIGVRATQCVRWAKTMCMSRACTRLKNADV